MSSFTANGKKIPLYINDSLESITNRIASSFNTLPSYIHIPEKEILQIRNGGEIHFTDFWGQIQENKDNVDILGFIENCINLGISPENIKKLYRLFIIYKKSLEGNRTFFENPAIQIQIENIFKDEVNIILDGNLQINTLLTAKTDLFIEGLEKEIRTFQIKVRKEEQGFKTLEETKETEYSEFVTTKLRMRIELELNITLIEFFNSIKVDSYIPFVKIGNYYKIYQNSTVFPDWLSMELEENSLAIKVNNLKNEAKSETSFIDVIATSENDMIILEYNLPLPSKTSGSFMLNGEQFRERLLKSININFNYKEIEKEKFGFFCFPNQFFDTYIFSDLCITNPIFTQIIEINELTKVTKRANNEYIQPKLYFLFKSYTTNFILGNIGQKTVNYYDPIYDNNIFKINEPYIRVYCKNILNSDLQQFQSTLAKLITIYKNSKGGIIDIYRRVLGTQYIELEDENGQIIRQAYEFGQDRVNQVEERNKNLLKHDNLNNIFVSGYPRLCPHSPIVVNENQIHNYPNYLKFPRDKNENNIIKFESDGVNQKYYVSDNPDYPFVGLIENNLENKGAYPYLPCCYKHPHENTDIFKIYYENLDPETIDRKVSTRFITTNKILNFNQKGKLYKRLVEMLSSIINSQEINRRGVTKSPGSFLECIVSALDHNNFNDHDNKKSFIQSLRRKLILKKYINASRQSTYDISIENIEEQLKNPEIYLSPKLYCQMLESIFKVNIYLFNSEEMILPNFINSYYIREPYDSSILVLEHLGAESDKSDYPQCELIEIDHEVQFNFTNFNDLFNIMNKFYILNKLIKPVEFTIPKSAKIISQVIDSYGKARQLNIEMGDRIYTVFTSPMPPQVALIDERIYETSSEFQNQIKTNITFLEKPYEEEKSELSRYHYNKKISRYITEYVFWYYSKYIEGKTMDIDSLTKFITKHLIIKENHDYGQIPKNFIEDGTILNNKQIICNSAELKKRLGYVLYMQFYHNSEILKNYKSNKYIINYYIDISDFTHYDNQIIFYGEDSVRMWLNNKVVTHILTSSIDTHKLLPYFFRNTLIDDNIYIAQNVNSIEQGVTVHNTWIERRINIGKNAEKSKDSDCILYVYYNNQNIKKYYVSSTSSKIKIVGSKIENSVYYTVLLPL